MKTIKNLKSLVSFVLCFCMVIGCIIPAYADDMEKELIKSWTFDTQSEVDSIATQSVSSKTLTDGGMLKIEGNTFPYIFPFDGMTLSVGKSYVIEFDAKSGEAATGSVVIECSGNFAENMYLGINTETVTHFEYEFTAQSSNVPIMALLNGGACSAYYDNICLYELVEPEDTAIKNKVIKGWTFDSQSEADSFVVDLGTGSKAYENQAVKITGMGAYTYPYDGVVLTVGKDYIVEFKGKTASEGNGGYFAIFGMYQNGDIGFCNFDANGNEATYSNRFTAYSPNPPYIVMMGTAAYMDDVYLYEVTQPATIVSSNPEADGTVFPTDKIEIEFSDELSNAALTASNWTLTDGNGNEIAISAVEKSGSRYTLRLADMTENKMSYTLSFEGLKSAYNQPLVTTSLEFVSYEGETVLNFPFSSAETSTWLYFQNGTGDFYNTQEYHSAPGSRWFDIAPGVEVYVKKGDGSDTNPPLVIGEEYIISFWAKPYVENEEDASNLNIFRINEGDRQYAGTYSFSGTDWQFFTSTFTQMGAGGLRFQFDRKDASLPVKMYVDDFKITKNVPLADFEIASSNPENGAMVGIVDGITVNFTETPGASAGDTSNYTLQGGTQTVFDAKISGNSVNLIFSEPLSENTAYSLTMNIKDVAGRDLTGRNTVSFKTAAKVLYRNYLSQNADFDRPVFNEYAEKAQNAALFNLTDGSELYIFQNDSYVNTPLEIGKTYSIMFKAATTQEGNAQNFALVASDNSSFVTTIYDLSTEMKTYTVNFVATTATAPFFRLYTRDNSFGAKVLLDDIVLYTVPDDEIYIEGIKLFANYGTNSQYEINSITDGNIGAVIENGVNCTADAQDIILAIAVYENGVLVNVATDDLTLAADQVIGEEMSAQIAVPAQTQGVTRTVKAFAWNTQTLSPLIANRVLSD